MKMAWLFPGQGTQTVGMAQDLYHVSPAARRLLDLADRALGFPLTRLLFSGPAEVLQSTLNAQPAIVAASLAALAAFREAWGASEAMPLPEPAFVAGHSVGEYAALVASGAADTETALRLVGERARLMHQAETSCPGGMVAVLGLERPVVADACRRARQQVAGSYVDIANHNAATQVTIAGDKEGLAAAAQLCREAGAGRCRALPVSGAFHSAAMAQAVRPLSSAVASATIQDAAIPLVGNVAARPIVAAQALKEELVEQVARPVLWADSVRSMIEAGTTLFVEFGPGQVLTNLIKRFDATLAASAVGDAGSVRAAVPWLAGLLGNLPVDESSRRRGRSCGRS